MSHQKDKVTRIMKDPLSADAVDKTGNISQQEILLDAVFWDYPKFRDETFLRDYLERNRDNSGYRWVLARFLERGRVVDTLKFFTIQEIASHMDHVKISSHTREKWMEIVETNGMADPGSAPPGNP